MLLSPEAFKLLVTHIFCEDISCVHKLVNDLQDPKENTETRTCQSIIHKAFILSQPLCFGHSLESCLYSFGRIARAHFPELWVVSNTLTSKFFSLFLGDKNTQTKTFLANFSLFRCYFIHLTFRYPGNSFEKKKSKTVIRLAYKSNSEVFLFFVFVFFLFFVGAISESWKPKENERGAGASGDLPRLSETCLQVELRVFFFFSEARFRKREKPEMRKSWQ